MTNIKPISDLVGLSEPLTKLLETVSSGIGTLYEPRKIRENAKAHADARIIEAKAEADALIIVAKADAEAQNINFRASERLSYVELRRQKNIEKIIQTSMTQLPEKVSSEKVDEDWTAKFFNYSQDVGNEEMQLIWAQILAREVAKPGSFSYRTLHIVNLLDREDATLFKLFCNYLWNNSFFFYGEPIDDYYKVHGLSYMVSSHLETLGLITQADLSFEFDESKNLEFSFFSRNYEFSSLEKKKTYLPFRQLTSTGQEIYTLCETVEDNDFIKTFIDSYVKLEYRPLKIQSVSSKEELS